MNLSFEKNKKELLERLTALRVKQKNPATSPSPAPGAHADSAIFGAHSPLIDDLAVGLKKEIPVASFHDAETAIVHCIDHPVRSVILDMDLPTDWRMSTDIFTTVRTIKPDVLFILLTKDPRSIPVRTLAAQSAIVLEKPFRMADLLRLILRE